MPRFKVMTGHMFENCIFWVPAVRRNQCKFLSFFFHDHFNIKWMDNGRSGSWSRELCRSIELYKLNSFKLWSQNMQLPCGRSRIQKNRRKLKLLGGSRPGWEFFSCGHLTGGRCAVPPCFLLQPGTNVSRDDQEVTVRFGRSLSHLREAVRRPRDNLAVM